jgi:hypothetical protein
MFGKALARGLASIVDRVQQATKHISQPLDWMSNR